MLNSDQTTRQIFQNLKEYYLNTEGVFVGAIDCLSGRKLDVQPIHEDLGDVVPFCLYYGETELARRQVNAALEAIRDWRFSNPRRPQWWKLDAYDWSDLLWGLIDWAESNSDRGIWKEIELLFERWNKTFVLPNGRAVGIAVKFPIPFPLPIAMLRSVGMYPELLVRWYRITRQEKYLRWAREIADQWLSDPFYQEFGLFPIASIGNVTTLKLICPLLVSCQKDRLYKVRVFKDNTNFVASLFALYEETRDRQIATEIARWLQQVSSRLVDDDGGVHMEWVPGGELGRVESSSFQIIDLMCDIHRLLDSSDALALASRVADFWLSQQGATGLFPYYAGETATSSDTQTDMSVALLKLAELSEEEKYYEAALKGLQGIAKFHYYPFGMANSVDINSGKVLDTVSKTKFYALSLKGWIALENYGRLFQEATFHDLLADR
ncbi:MAG TPA: hypothetical protein ENI39_00740 [Anaerolineae bacterium]|nr:hypothetical protein [Anaerolineae bacterium]